MDQLEELLKVPDYIDLFGIQLLRIVDAYIREKSVPLESELYQKWKSLDEKFGIHGYFPDECIDLYLTYRNITM